jgi:hypothetical protein
MDCMAVLASFAGAGSASARRAHWSIEVLQCSLHLLLPLPESAALRHLPWHASLLHLLPALPAGLCLLRSSAKFLPPPRAALCWLQPLVASEPGAQLFEALLRSPHLLWTLPALQHMSQLVMRFPYEPALCLLHHSNVTNTREEVTAAVAARWPLLPIRILIQQSVFLT